MNTMKKNLFGTVCMLAVLSACRETPQASIEAQIAGLTDGMAYVTWMAGEVPITDSVPVKDGKFSWKGTLSEPQKVLIRANDQFLELFMENNAVQITGTIDSFYFSKVTGSPIQDEWAAFNESLKEHDAKMRSLITTMFETPHEAGKSLFEKQLDSMGSIRVERMKDYIRSHPSSFISLNLVREMTMDRDWAELDSLWRGFDPKIQETAMGRWVAKRLDVLKRSTAGQPVKDFTQNDVNGKPVKISDFKGKYLFIDFWASWCGPCRQENPNVLKAYQSFKDKGFEVLGISLDTDAEKWKKAIEEDKLPWTQVSDLQGFRNEIARYYGIQAIPFSFLVDPNGVIIARGLRGPALQEKLAEVLQ